jgi:methyl-accepting chemotaxis protein
MDRGREGGKEGGRERWRHLSLIISNFITSHAIQLADQVNQSASGALDNATSINSTAQELANDVSMATAEVDQLEQTVREDQEAITMATDTATESIAVANNLTEQITTIQVRDKKIIFLVELWQTITLLCLIVRFLRFRQKHV